MIIDTHAHLDFPDYKDDVDEVIERARKVGVEYLINVGTTVASSTKSIELTKQYEQIYASIGIHPNEASKVSGEEWSRLEALAGGNKVVAIGETGLDYYRDRSKREDQKRLFHQHIELAQRHNLPVIIHNREASDDCLEIVREYNGKVKGVVHCFAGTVEDAEEFLKYSGQVIIKRSTNGE